MAKLALQGSNVFSYTFGINGAQDNYIYASNTRNNSVLNVGGESWTIEFWAKTANAIYSTEQALFALRAPGTVTTSIYGFLRVANSGAITFYNGTSYNSNYILPPNVWTHIAYVFNQGANTRIFVNGSNVMTTTAVTSITNIDAPFYIGGLGGFSYQYFGEISNFRMIRGQAVYSGESFNVSTFPMQLPNNSIGPHATGANVASSLTGNVVLLTCNDQYLKTNGNSVINGFSTLGTVSYHSIDTKELQNFSYYYPGNTGPGQNGTVLVTSTTNSLNLNGDFTIETWYYPTSNTGVVLERGLGGVGGNNASYIIVWDGQNNQLNFASSNANGNTYSVGSLTGPTGNIGKPTINSWNHIAVSHTGTTYRGFLNGNLNLTITNNANVPYAALGRGVTIGGMFQAGQTYATGIPSNTISGYISNMRIIRGNSIYNAAFTPSTTAQLGNVTNTILLTALTPAFEDLSSVHTLATNGQNQISISTISPITPNSVRNANAANVSLNIKTLGSRRTRIYNKLNYSNFNKSIPIFNAMGKRQTRIYNKLNYLNFTSSVPVFNTIGNEQSRIYNKLNYSNFNKSVPIFNTMGKRQTRIYSKSDYSKFAYIPMGQVPSNQYEFWS